MAVNSWITTDDFWCPTELKLVFRITFDLDTIADKLDV